MDDSLNISTHPNIDLGRGDLSNSIIFNFEFCFDAIIYRDILPIYSYRCRQGIRNKQYNLPNWPGYLKT